MYRKIHCDIDPVVDELQTPADLRFILRCDSEGMGVVAEGMGVVVRCVSGSMNSHDISI